MEDYEKYIDQLRRAKPPLDGGRMYGRIKDKLAHQRRRQASLICTGGLAAMLFGVVLFFYGLPFLNYQKTTLTDYVFQQNDLNGDPIMNYVLAD